MLTQEQHYMPRTGMVTLLTELQQRGYEVIGPGVQDGAIVFHPLTQVDSLPQGIEQTQQPGHYRLHQTESARYFSWANGPQALKPLTFAPRETLWRSEQNADGSLRFTETLADRSLTAVIGIRGCDLAALALQEQHFAEDPYYRQRRANLLLIAVDCSHPADTCFCASTGDGPGADRGYDIALTELDDGYLVRANSEPGKAVLAALPLEAASQKHLEQADDQHRHARQQQRQLPRFDPERLIHQGQSAVWEAVADRCLSCGNCTSVCPSCFCFSEQEVPELDGQTSSHQRQWDSCFSEGHSYIHGHRFRPDTRGRYRQWLTHKFGSWVEQYGRSGCTGCGRCISWCPVGIDPLEILEQLGQEGTDE
ncbi:4Fe-4S dicluster domain-containing protein [Marinobacterium sp. AK62]|uniref:4Fe-4S dicluster domain-containing protein n=1 Tax=Marinobacterium alkalitolerans TaxID=1542925 RepID=A0ABS3Z6U3_9GAMM|nr:4Fe-4S dicluster domain-containing protein [Marinobacterium alkalitolerans]MBP0047423.1 4Fe-4S dicluster domain-containing protein [Marinobacterium alkalitolerans]